MNLQEAWELGKGSYRGRNSGGSRGDPGVRANPPLDPC